MLQKHSPYTNDVNKVLSQMRAGGLIYHYWHEPLYLDLTIDPSVFTYVDDSKEKLSLETFLLIFIVWAVGMGIGILSLLAEIINFWFKRNQ
jgi:hypothetical protein